MTHFRDVHSRTQTHTPSLNERSMNILHRVLLIVNNFFCTLFFHSCPAVAKFIPQNVSGKMQEDIILISFNPVRGVGDTWDILEKLEFGNM